MKRLTSFVVDPPLGGRNLKETEIGQLIQMLSVVEPMKRNFARTERIPQ
jgi:hypothetical protein